jgi:outer membrane lipoprotein carrier protein
MDLLGLVTKTFLAVMPAAAPAAAPTRPAIVTLPLVGAPTAAPVVAVATAPTASDVVDKVQAFYAGINQVTASFRQSVTYDTFGSTKTSDGKLWIQKPGKMRWDYYDKKKSKITTKKSFISNGAYLYMVEHDNKQVVKKNLQKDLMPVAVSFLYGKGDLKAEFTPELDRSGTYGGKAEVVLKLTPKKASAQYKNLILVVNPENYRVTQSIIIDSSNNVNHFRFYQPDFKAKVDARWFEFDEKSVKSYRMVDADQQQGSGAGSASNLMP